MFIWHVHPFLFLQYFLYYYFYFVHFLYISLILTSLLFSEEEMKTTKGQEIERSYI